MPGGNGTGPMGAGPMTGRGAGYCAGYNMPGYANPVLGRGAFGNRFGRGRGWGRGFGFGSQRGWRNNFYATGLPGWARAGYGHPNTEVFNPEDEMNFLKQESEILKQQLEDIQNRIASLENTESSKNL